jgi:Type I phosphodiesterase / nucleotide pyrophosphatase
MLTKARLLVVVLLVSWIPAAAFASAYNGRPKLVVVIVIDQFRGDLVERYHDQFGETGFRTFIEKGAFFPDCAYQYASTRTAPGHASLGTGTYTSGHGIMTNEWWSPTLNRVVSSVDDEKYKMLGASGGEAGVSPHNLQADTFGDELRLATNGTSRVFGVALKDRASILPTGYSANAAYFIDHQTGAFITSTYYMAALPQWVKDFNGGGRAAKYLNMEWKDADGAVLRSTAPQKNLTKAGTPAGFYDVVGPTPFANDYEFEFARELVTQEKLGMGATTDVLVVSLSSHDILGHQSGPNSPQETAMTLAIDKQIGEFIGFLGRQLGLANVWLALTADHGIAPLPKVAAELRFPAKNIDGKIVQKNINQQLASRISNKGKGSTAEFVPFITWPVAFLNEQAFKSAGVANEADAESMVGDMLVAAGMRGYYTRVQLANGQVPHDEFGMRYSRAYSPLPGWYVQGVSPPFVVGYPTGTDHALPYTYDMHVPLAFYGLPFQPGVYRGRCEPVDMAPTLSSLLGINAPTHAIGRVLTEALHQPGGAK